LLLSEYFSWHNQSHQGRCSASSRKKSGQTFALSHKCCPENHSPLQNAKHPEAAKTLPEVEDLYLPYKRKQHSKAANARKKGLDKHVKMLLENDDPDCTPEEIAKKF